MGLLNLFTKPEPSLLRLPSGSFSVDRGGKIVVGTLPYHFPREMAQAIADAVLQTFQEASNAHLPMGEMVVNYPSLKITAREMRGGALIFMMPKTTMSSR